VVAGFLQLPCSPRALDPLQEGRRVADTYDRMNVLVWIGVGLAGLLAFSLLVALAVARILGAIGDELAQLLEAEPWTSAPLTREGEVLADARKIDSGTSVHNRRSHSSRK
jgi:hypothetical protein